MDSAQEQCQTVQLQRPRGDSTVHRGDMIQSSRYEHGKITFFDLPRELRDLIYQDYWQTNPVLTDSSTRFCGLLSQLRYEGRYIMEIDNHAYNTPRHVAQSFPRWALANKQLFDEAFSHFESKAEWFWYDNVPVKRYDHQYANLVNLATIRSITLYVQDLKALEDQPRRRGRRARAGLSTASKT
jgi:hypothetical protein